MFHSTSICKAPTICWAPCQTLAGEIWPGESPRQPPLPGHSLGEQDGATACLFWLSPEPPYTVLYSCAHGVIRLLPACLTHNITAPPGLPYQCLPLSLPSLLPFHSFFLCLIKKHLLAIHCSSEQNLYFRHVEPWILNLNTNVAGGPNYFICP